MAIMARDSLEVDKLLKRKPQATDLFYPLYPHMRTNMKEKRKAKQGTEKKETKE